MDPHDKFTLALDFDRNRCDNVYKILKERTRIYLIIFAMIGTKA